MSKVLFIPHAPATPLRTRAGELAKALARAGHWVDVYAQELQPPGLSLPEKMIWHAKQLLGVRKAGLGPNLQAVYPPALYRLKGAQDLVHALSAQILAMGGYDAVVSAAYCGLWMPPARSRKLVYDFVDDHAAGLAAAGRRQEASLAAALVERQIRMADAVTASSLVLARIAKEKYGREAELIPNGADIQAIRGAAEPDLPKSPLRVGYIGGLDGFVRIDFAARAVGELRKGGLEAELFVVGEGPAIRGWEAPPWVRLLGFHPPSAIPGLLRTFHVGIVPFELSPFTHAALPLKVLEYGAARRPCVSAPLEELKLQGFPWVTLRTLAERQWAEAIDRASRSQWDPSWDGIVDQFSWERGARRMTELIG